MATPSLSVGSVQAMYNGETASKPIVQIIDVKMIQGPNNNPGERYRLVISDGVHYQQAMLATQLNHLVNQGHVIQNAIIRLNEYICNTVHNRKIVIILQLDHVAFAAGNIGNPQNVEPSPQQNNTTAPKPNPPPQQNQRPQTNYQAPPQQQHRQQYSAPSSSSNSNSNSNSFHPPGQSLGIHGPGEDLSGHLIQPVKALTPYQNKWTIKVRVGSKSEVKNYAGKPPSGKPGKLFNVDVIDQEKGEIRITMFNDHVDKFEPMLVKGHVYYISKGALKIANKRYNTVNNEYEITANHETLIQECFENDADIPTVSFSFVPIGSISQRNKDDIVDIIAIGTNIGNLDSIVSKKSQENLDKRSITLEDDSGASIEMTIWGEMARNFPDLSNIPNPVIAIKGTTVSDYNNRSLNGLRSTLIEINPDLPEAHRLRGWWDSRGGQSSGTSLSTRSYMGGAGGAGGSGGERKCMSHIKDQNLGSNGTPAYFKVKGTISLIKHDVNSDPWYIACTQCQKKVTGDPGNYNCGKCGQVYNAAEPRYILAMVANDHTGSSWLSGFNDHGQAILGYKAQDLQRLKETSPPDYEDVFSRAQFQQFSFRIRAKEETYMEEKRIKCQIMNADPLNFTQECKYLLEQIAKFN